ncbi:efflux RND transporter permease subunit [Maribrevibacterium harenarium]|uniref:Efflux RND transporter permease subunit n=1 Tax=Maribrevibacterium harenarium TaxID=2589817 RepID=A0A501WKE3_9GAMM|nr:efflux RND transporter permease subunit [Maribrevibacterium harenarium]TPE47511.1 efflux RND transporter permease subunit [Maribrevibacterium harenarium]
MSDQQSGDRMGLSGRIAKAFLTTEITPLLALVGLLLGIFAVMITPREEEPQINVTFANVFIPFPGASAKEVESLVTTPAEQIVSEIKGVEHVYSVSSPGMSTLTVRFEIGENRTDAIVRLYNAFYAKGAWVPPNSGVGQVLIKPKGIDDVPIVTGTLWSRDGSVTNAELMSIARTLQTELQRVPGTREISIVGGEDRVVKVQFDAQKLSSYGLSLNDLRGALGVANTSYAAGSLLENQQEVLVQAGQFLTNPSEVADLVVSVVNGAPVFLRDVASISYGEDTPSQYVLHGVGPASDLDIRGRYPAITLAVAKKEGENAVDVASNVIERFEQLRGIYFPDGVDATVTRDYGATAEDKAQTLIKKLIFATLSVIVLVVFALGRRESIVVGAAVIVTLAMTLFASWAWGFTLNRVSLFALIFSIGILVDDAIVVVENIHRHLMLGKMSLREAIPVAVDEVGSPTILATFTVIAALLPMAFVTGLMGPYMSPIPINASTGMLISLAVAFIFTPWLYRRLFENVHHDHAPAEDSGNGRFYGFFKAIMTPFLRKKDGRMARVLLLVTILVLITGSVGLAVYQKVVLKMLPFDNKSEFQVVVDMPEGTALETTQIVLQALADKIDTVPEVTHYQLYAGTAAPINFNGLVRQYYLRSQPHMGDIQVNLLDKSLRDRKSHEIALATRDLLAPVAKQYGANVKVVEVPPGPPVMSPLVAEVYGLDYDKQVEVARSVRQAFEQVDDIVDVDDTIEAPQTKLNIVVDRARAAYFGVDQATITSAINTAMNGENVSYLHDDHAKVAIPVRLELPGSEKNRIEAITSLKVRSQSDALVPLSEVVQVVKTTRDQSIYHKDMLPVVYVMSDAAGHLDSPLYSLAEVYMALEQTPIDGQILDQYLNSQPENPYRWSLKWDGELQVTLDTFRDMGIAYSVGLVMIYLLVVGMFKSYSVPLIIMAPIPLTIIGIMPGHALLGQQFTAPSMIGMIALAGIIVRNSILLVDFIQQEVREGKNLQEATINAAAVRALPIMLTAVAAMMGGFFIIDDPIFGGLAVSLIFGLLVSTVLTLLVIPVVYYAYQYKKHA